MYKEIRSGGIDVSEIDLREETISVNRITRVVEGGRIFGYSAAVVVGDGNGVVGYGSGKASTAPNAIAKGGANARKNLIRVPLNKGTLPHESFGKCSGSKIMIKPAAPGTGIKAGGSARVIFECLGLRDVLAKCIKRSSPANVAKATMEALSGIKDPATIAKNRGVSLDKLFKG